MPKPVYLDNNATTAVDPRVLEAMLPFFTTMYGNAASHNHPFGWQAAEATDLAREQIAALIGALPQEIIFTSGGTESVNLALKGVYETYRSKGNHVITASTEHKAVLDTCRHLEKLGADLTIMPVDEYGRLDLTALESAIRPDTILMAVMYANNETGLIHPVSSIGEIAKKHNVIFFTDAVQAVGKIPVDVHRDGIDLMSLSAHKIYGPKGVGALYVRRRDPRVRLAAQMDGRGHERGLRSGTLNVPGIVGFGKAAEIAREEMKSDALRIAAMRDFIEENLMAEGGVKRNGDRVNRLPGTSNLSFAGIRGNSLLTALSKTIAISSGSACTSALPEPSHVLLAMGVDSQLADAAIRFGLGRYTTMEEIKFVIEQVKLALQEQSTDVGN